MNKPLRKLLGVMGIGLSWGTVWGAPRNHMIHLDALGKGEG